MYICKNCGQRYMTDEAVMCVNCRTPRGMGNQFCPCCGNQAAPNARVCQYCGVDMADFGCPVSDKSKIAAGLLGIFLGCYGVHNFYLGYLKKGFIQLGCIVGSIVLVFVFGLLMALFENNEMALISVVLFFLADMALVIGVQIWAFVESIMIFCGKINRDGKGRLLRS